MRCAHVIPYMSMRAGGPVVVADRLCRQISRRGVEAIVLTTDAFTDGADGAPATSVDPMTCRCEYELHRCRSRWGRYAYSRSLACTLDRIIPMCDLVHIHTLWTYSTAAAVRACRNHDVPYVVMPHGMLDPHARSRKPLRKWLYGSLFEYPRMRAAAGIVYTTEEEQRLAETSLGRRAGGAKDYVVPLGADAPPGERSVLTASFVSAHPELASKRLVTFLGRIHEKKGLDLLLPAFAELLSRVPDAHLLVVGPDEGNTWGRLEHHVERLGLRPHVTRMEMLLDAAKWSALAASQVFVLPSYQENFAITVAEALRIGTPVVVSDRVNIWPAITAAGAGRVVPCDAEPLASALCSVLDGAPPVRSPGTNARASVGRAWQRMSEAAVRLATTQFDWGRSANALLDVYDRVLSVAKRRRDGRLSDG